ncbi:MAG: SPOR domain-containing protein [Faecalimonas sp.]|nr:SPOR domain-containing protein [Faecalimonas sp.]
MPVNSCTVQVSFTWVGPPLYTVSAVVGGGEGTVHFGGGSTSAEVTEGTIINFQTTPASGYKVSEIWVGDSFFVPINNGADAVYQFSMPAADYEVRAVFTPLDTVSYRVRCGTFMTIEQAVELMDLLAEQEISAYIGTVNGQYIVYAGIYEAKDAANEAVRQITAKGFGAYVSTT